MSTDHQRYSLDNQAAAIADYASIQGYEIVKTYVDAGRSGVTTKRREGLSQLLADVVGGRADFEAVLILDVSRWGRFQDADEAGHYEFLCRAAGVDIVYSGEGFVGGLAGSIFKHVKRVMAAEYSRELSAKVRASKRRSAQAGNAPGGRCPYGFARQIVNPDGALGRVLERHERKARPDQRLRMVPEGAAQSKVLRRIFSLYVSDRLSPVRIAERMNAMGSPWSDGSPWTSARISHVLKCDLVTGRQPFGRTTCLLGEAKRSNPANDWGSVEIFAPIVSLKTFQAARRRLRINAYNQRKTSNEMLDDLRAIFKKYGRVSGLLINADSKARSASSYSERFGSLANAYALIGFAYAPQARGRRSDGSRLSRSEVLERLRQLYAGEGRISPALCQADHSLPALSWIRAEFGGLVEAFLAAGLPYRRLRGRPAGYEDSSTIEGAAARACPIEIGPLGGRYFITAKGRKRYGV